MLWIHGHKRLVWDTAPQNFSNKGCVSVQCYNNLTFDGLCRFKLDDYWPALNHRVDDLGSIKAIWPASKVLQASLHDHGPHPMSLCARTRTLYLVRGSKSLTVDNTHLQDEFGW